MAARVFNSGGRKNDRHCVAIVIVSVRPTKTWLQCVKKYNLTLRGYLSYSRRKFIKQASIAGGAGLLAPLAASRDDLGAQTADVVIVGSGPAGLGLADKLSAAGVDVTVIESGVNKPDQSH